MKTKLAALLLAGSLALVGVARAQENTNELAQLAQIRSILQSLKYQSGTIDLRGGLATLSIPTNFNYLGPEDAETVLVKLWHNPPQHQKPLGLLIPAGMTPMSSNVWVVTINYSEDGYVKDADAGKIDYDDLLKQMQKGIAAANKERQQQGYRTITLVGWAAPPRYDAGTHKLYWAKELNFEGDPSDTLNYSIRMLGRKGVLELNAIASIEQFHDIDQQTPQILGMVDFKEGNRYADFDPKVDKVATYGLAALVLGGIAAKVGLFKLLWVGLLALKKFVIIGVLAVVAFIKKLFNRNVSSSNNPPANPPTS